MLLIIVDKKIIKMIIQERKNNLTELFRPVNEDVRTLLAGAAVIIGVGGLIGWAIYAGAKRQAAIEKMINDEFTIVEIKEIRKILDSDPKLRKYRRDLETYEDLHYKSRLVNTGNEQMDQFKNVMADMYSDHMVKDAQYKIDSRTEQILSKDYYQRITALDDRIMRKYGCTSSMLY